MQKNIKFVIFFDLDWLSPRVILLDSKDKNKNDSLTCPIYCSYGRSDSAISCLRLWGFISMSIFAVKEKLLGLSIFCSLRGNLMTAQGCEDMNKRDLIDCICEINKSAKPEFLASFSEEELNAYLEHLMELDLEELVVCN